MTLKHSELFPAGSEIMCKYFTGVRDRRYGDLQTVRPAPAWDGLPGKYAAASANGFVNITLDDGFLVETVADLARGPLPRFPEPEDTGAAYRVYVFSTYVHEIWGAAQCAEPAVPAGGRRRLFAMAFFLAQLAKESPAEPLKLFELFSQDLYSELAEGTLLGAAPEIKCLAAAALRLRAFPAI